MQPSQLPVLPDTAMQHTEQLFDELRADPDAAAFLPSYIREMPSDPSEIEGGSAERQAGGEADCLNLTIGYIPTENVIQAASEYGATTDPANSEKWCVTLTDFGSGDTEWTVSYAQDGWGKKLKSKRNKPRDKGDVPKRNKEDVARSLRQTQKSIRHKVMMMEADKMVTMTTQEPIVHIDDMKMLLTVFFRLARAKIPNFKYLAVLERHDSEKTSKGKLHSLHVHFATVGRIDYNLLRDLWRTVVSKHRGTAYEAANINVSLSSGKNAKGSYVRIKRAQMARYMSKYVATDIEFGDPCKKRFWASKNIEKPRKLRIYFASAVKPAYFFRRVIEDISGVQIKFCYAPPRESGSHVPILFFSSG